MKRAHLSTSRWLGGRRHGIRPDTGLIACLGRLEGGRREPSKFSGGSRNREIEPIGAPSKQDVLSFIGASFRSVWALEVLCFLRQNRARGIPHAEIVVGLRGSDLIVTQSTGSLITAGLVAVEEDGSFRYRPATPELDTLVEATTTLYAKSPDAVRRMIVASANPNITAFADAFRLRKD